MDLAPQRRLAAIMFTDIVGYSRLMGADEARAMRLLDRHDAILGEQVRAHGGEILKKMGDSVFAAVFLIVSMAMFHLYFFTGQQTFSLPGRNKFTCREHSAYQ